MKLNEKAFAIASAGSFSIVWIVCSLLVMVMPDMMSNMSGKCCIQIEYYGMVYDF